MECVGNADRSCYDLSQHTRATGVKLVAERKLPTPVSFKGYFIRGLRSDRRLSRLI